MNKFVLVVMFMAVALGAGGCCTVERKTIDRLEESMDRQHVKYLKYVEADDSLLGPQKRIERNNVASQKELLKQLKTAAKK